MSADIIMPFFIGKAECAEIGGDEWFPEPGGGSIEITANARRICNVCEIRTPCLEWALNNSEAGIWGGTTERERVRLAQRRGTA